jgi:hypothetical protein
MDEITQQQEHRMVQGYYTGKAQLAQQQQEFSFCFMKAYRIQGPISNGTATITSSNMGK